MEGRATPAALPRALDVQRFAGAREQEIRALVSAIQEGPQGAQIGVAALPRHLRRRAGSHKPYHGHRFRPNAKLQGKRRKVAAAAGRGEGEPGAAEADGGAPDPEAAAVSARPFTNRLMRRQPAALAEQHRLSASWTEAQLESSSATTAAGSVPLEAGPGLQGEPAAGSGSGGSSTAQLRRLETHVWHAKRLSMEERYGWLLPAGAAGQGRGDRSFCHTARASALIHDASYHCPLLLRGPWAGAHALLSALLPPEQAAGLAADWAASSSSFGGGSGAGRPGLAGWEQEVMLHHPGRQPLGAICPAQLLLAPCSGGGSGGAGASSRDSGHAAMEVDAPAAAADGTQVQACLWVHPAAAAEAYAALRLAASQLPEGPARQAVSLRVADLRRLEIRGGMADAALAVALRGTTAGAARQLQQEEAWEQAQGQAAGQGQAAPQGQAPAAGKQEERRRQAQPRLQVPLPAVLAGLHDGEAVQLLLPDPRLCKPVVLGSLSASLLARPAAGGTVAGQPEQLQQQADAEEGEQLLQQQRLDLNCLLGVPLPLPEAQLSARRQQLRRRMLHLPPPTAAGAEVQLMQVEQQAAGEQQGQHGWEEQEGQQQLAEHEVQKRGWCPAVLVRADPAGDGGIPGWSLILPAGWVAPFWLAAAYAGCKPAGQREWRWLAALQQASCFPWDHPDTAGYAALMRQQGKLRREAAARRPKGKKMVAAPALPPDWRLLGAVAAAAGGAQQGQEQRQGGQQQGQQQHEGRDEEQQEGQQQQQAGQPMEVDCGEAQQLGEHPAAASAGQPPVAQPAPSAASSAQPQLFVARSYAAMAAALHGSASGGSNLDAAASSEGAASRGEGGSRPVAAAALRFGHLQWRPKQPSAGAASAGTASSSQPQAPAPLCLLEAAVFPVKTGSLAEGAAICAVSGWEAQRCRAPLQVLTARQQRRRQRELEEGRTVLSEAGGDPSEAVGTAGSSGWAAGEVGEEDVQAIGFVLSEAPRGAPRRCGALAAVAAGPAWRLRSLQFRGPAGDGGAVLVFARNPGSAALFPVRLQLLAERS